MRFKFIAASTKAAHDALALQADYAVSHHGDLFFNQEVPEFIATLCKGDSRCEEQFLPTLTDVLGTLTAVSKTSADLSGLGELLSDPTDPSGWASAAAAWVPIGDLTELANAYKAIRDINDAEHSINDARQIVTDTKDASKIADDGGAATTNSDTFDLQAHEDAGGHTIERHVGMSDDALIARNKRLASTFNDFASAENVTAENIAANSESIDSWLAGDSGRLTITDEMDPTLGRVYDRSSGSFLEPSSVSTVLQRSPGGYYVLTSYPEP